MKVIHIEDRFHPDMGYQINYFAEYHNQNTEFHILSSKSFSLWKGINKDKIILYNDKNFERKFNVKITRLDSFNSKDEKYNIWLKDLFQTIDKISPDIVYTHALETLTSIRIILSKLNRKVLIVSDTHTLMNQQNKGLKSKVFDIFLHNIYVPAINRKNIIVFYTADENKKILLDIYGIKKTNVFPSLIGTNLKDYRFDEIAREKIRQKLNIDFNSPLILYTGKLNNKKRPHLLLEAVKEIEDSLMQKIHLVFVGPQDQEYMQRNFNIKFSDKVKIYLVGSVLNKELFKYYSAADFVVFPKENTLSALDSQACKVPVIMEEDETNHARLKEGGLCYKKNNIADLSEKILTLLNEKSLLEKLSENGYKYIRENYDYETIVKQMERILSEKLSEFKKG